MAATCCQRGRTLSKCAGRLQQHRHAGIRAAKRNGKRDRGTRSNSSSSSRGGQQAPAWGPAPQDSKPCCTKRTHQHTHMHYMHKIYTLQMLLKLLLNKIGHCTLDCNPPAAADHIIPDHEPKVTTTLSRSMAVSTDRPSLCQCCHCLLRHLGASWSRWCSALDTTQDYHHAPAHTHTTAAARHRLSSQQQ